MSLPANPVVLQGRNLFADLLSEADRLGFRLAVAPDALPGIAAARLEPLTPRARTVVQVANGPDTAGIEATASHDPDLSGAWIDATRAAARAALDLARSAGA